MSAALVILPTPVQAEVVLPKIWATAAGSGQEAREAAETTVEVAFYRKYTEALLRRYMRLSMEAGRTPSLLGREMFRGKVTNYRVHGFDDVVIFVHDVERCLTTLDAEQQHLIQRIALQEYTQGETATMMKLPLRTVLRRYAKALDVLTKVFLEKKLLEPQKACQEGGLHF